MYFSRVLKEEKKEEHILFNDAFNTFYLLLYDIEHMVKHHSDSERGNLFYHFMGYSLQLASFTDTIVDT